MSLLALPALAADSAKATSRSLGIVIHSYGIHVQASRKRGDKVPFSAPRAFIDHGHALGAAGVQVALGMPDKEESAAIRRRLEATGMYIEGIVRLPASKTDADRFSRELAAAKELGAKVVRTVCLS